MKKKYIIDLNPDCVEGEYLRIPARIAGEEQWLVTKAVLAPYTEPDLEQVRNESFEKGYSTAVGEQECAVRGAAEKAYQRGLNDAWEAARKIGLTAGLSIDAMYSIFGTEDPEPILREYSVNECIEKIRQYEQKQEEIQVWDEVINGRNFKGTVTDIEDNGMLTIFCQDGTWINSHTRFWKKTGRRFDEIAEVLKKMRSES